MLYKILILIGVFIIIFLSLHKSLAKADTIPYQTPKIEYSNEFNRIGLCESNADLHAKNPYSTASGEFQFIWSSWNHYGKELWGSKFYEKNIWSTDNRELAWYVYSKYGTRDWLSSKSCWSTSK